LNTADIILLLVSPDFIALDYCYQVEMQCALERHRLGEARVTPVLLRPVDWHEASFAHLQCLPRNDKPVTEWDNLDAAFRDITSGIRTCHHHAFTTFRHLYCHRFIARHRQHVGVLMRFQPNVQVQIPPLYGIGDYPSKGNLCATEALDHPLGQFTFRLKANCAGNACLTAPLPILDPAQREIEFSIQQRVAQAAGVGEKYPHLTIFDLARRSAILLRHSCQLFPSFAKTGFIDHQDRLRITQLLLNVGTQIISHQVGIPGCAVE